MMKSLLLIAFLLAAASRAVAQPSLRVGQTVPDYPLERVLGKDSSVVRLRQLQRRITLLDFFGTWCAPCLRALPNLQGLQQRNAGILQVVLLSTEPEEKLRAFLLRQPQPFPLVVDTGEKITRQFAPPAYPYTLVLDAEGRILASVDAATVSDAQVRQWLNTVPPASPERNTPPLHTPTQMSTGNNALLQLSQDFVYAARTGSATDNLRGQIARLSAEDLRSALRTDNEKNAFWINLYNGFTQALLREDSSRYRKRNRFFSGRQLPVAGRQLSLDDIEHGILRRSRLKWSLGYFGKTFPGNFEKQMRVRRVDPRIHFALNCGARSCPPVAYYKADDLDRQLDLATANYLKNGVLYSPSDNVIDLPAIMGWFRADFDGKKGMRQLLRKHGIIHADAQPKIRFLSYDWTLELNNSGP